MSNILGKSDFVEIINDVKKVTKYQEGLNSYFQKSGVDGYIFQPDCIDTALRLLHVMFGEADRDNWIEYFCYELNFGKKWAEGCVTRKDGTDIKLETPEDLYNYLISMN